MIVANSCRCAKCDRLLSYEERIKITAYKFIEDKQCSGSTNKTVDSFNLCLSCYKKYIDFTSKFF